MLGLRARGWAEVLWADVLWPVLAGLREVGEGTVWPPLETCTCITSWVLQTCWTGTGDSEAQYRERKSER